MTHTHQAVVAADCDMVTAWTDLVDAQRSHRHHPQSQVMSRLYQAYEDAVGAYQVACRRDIAARLAEAGREYREANERATTAEWESGLAEKRYQVAEQEIFGIEDAYDRRVAAGWGHELLDHLGTARRGIRQ